MTKRIHAVLKPDFDNDPTRKAKLRELVLRQFSLKNLNEGRFRNLGVLTGDVDVAMVNDIRRIDGLLSVSVDEGICVS